MKSQIGNFLVCVSDNSHVCWNLSSIQRRSGLHSSLSRRSRIRFLWQSWQQPEKTSQRLDD